MRSCLDQKSQSLTIENVGDGRGMTPRKHAKDFRTEAEKEDDAGHRGQGDVVRQTEDLPDEGPRGLGAKVTRRQGSRT